MPLLCPVLKEHYRLASKSGLDAVYHEGSAQRDSHDAYDLNDTRNKKEQRDTVTDYSECLQMVTILASPLCLLLRLSESLLITVNVVARCSF